MSRYPSGDVQRAELAIVTCPETTEAGLRLSKIAAATGTIHEIVDLTADLNVGQRAERLKEVDPKTLVVVRCPLDGCVSLQTIAAGTEFYGAPPVVLQSAPRPVITYETGDTTWQWKDNGPGLIDEVPLHVVHAPGTAPEVTI